jgi:hypothetical protein
VFAVEAVSGMAFAMDVKVYVKTWLSDSSFLASNLLEIRDSRKKNGLMNLYTN